MGLHIEYYNQKMGAQQFSPTIFKHLTMTNDGQNIQCNVQKLLNKVYKDTLVMQETF
jgi:hypothetical protein